MKLAWDPQSRREKSDGYVRRRSDEPYHSSRWTKLARAWKVEHPLCEECKRKGIIKAAEVVDHIIPWPICQDFFDRSNLQSLCEDCNREKGYKDRPVIERWKKEHNKRR